MCRFLTGRCFRSGNLSKCLATGASSHFRRPFASGQLFVSRRSVRSSIRVERLVQIASAVETSDWCGPAGPKTNSARFFRGERNIPRRERPVKQTDQPDGSASDRPVPPSTATGRARRNTLTNKSLQSVSQLMA